MKRSTLLFALLVAPCTGQFREPSFGGRTVVLDGAASVAVGDVDDDCRPDLVVATQTADDEIVVLLGDGVDGFSRHASYITPNNPHALELADMNGDGHLDVVYATINSGQIFVRLGDGEGAFATASAAPGATFTDEIALVDVNHDGNLDAALASRQQEKIVVLLGDGAGNLASPLDLPLGGDVFAVSAADMDGDTHVDLLAATDAGEVILLLGDGTGAFAAPTVLLSAGVPRDIEPVDFDGDGDLDIVVARNVGPDVVVLDNSAGTFVLGASALLGGASATIAIDCGDVDGDGVVDVVVGVDAQSGGFFIVRGDGAGAFSPAEQIWSLETGFEVVAADIDGNGRDDVVVVDASDEVVALHLSSNASVAAAVVSDAGTLLVDNIVITPLDDGDQHADLIGTSGAQLIVLRGDGSGVFVADPSIANGTALALAVTDVDGDGAEDVVTVNAENTVSWLPGDLAGGLLAPVVTSAGGVCQGLALGDLNGDGRDDVVTGNADSSVSILLSTPTGLSSPTVVGTAASPGTLVAVVDADADNDNDVLVLSDETVLVLEGDGTGAIVGAATRTISAAFPVFPRFAKDVNGDGRPDLLGNALCGGGALCAFVALDDGVSGYTLSATQPLPSGLNDDLALDVDGDGAIDIVGFSQALSQLVLVRGDGLGGLGPVETYAGDALMFGFAAGDLNDDARVDLVWSAFDPTFGVLFNGPSIASPWTDLGSALPASTDPFVFGRGALVDDTEVSLCLEGARPGAMTTLIVGISVINAPFKGGVMVPSPDVLFGPFLVGVDGRLRFDAIWPQGLPPSTFFAFQHWYDDPMGPKNLAASNGISGVTP